MHYGRLMCANMMFASVEESLLFCFLEKAMPTWEKRRSTEADDAGLPGHHLEVGKVLLVLEPPLGGVPLALELDLWEREVLGQLVRHTRRRRLVRLGLGLREEVGGARLLALDVALIALEPS